MKQFISDVIIQRRLRTANVPLLISWALTYRCNQRCLYCQIRKIRCRELKTEEVFSVIDELAWMKTILICLSGGEPLFRDDIGEITDCLRKKKIAFDISSNGSLIKKKISQIEGTRVLCLSLDGPEKLHDRIRGRKGAYKEVLEAARIAKKRRISVYFRTVLSKLNLNQVDYILGIAKESEVKVLFQPATQLIYGTGRLNPFTPSSREYRSTIDKLMIEKKNGNEYIHSSLSVLKYIRQWPTPKRIFCSSGKIFFHIGPDGMIYPCIWGRDPEIIEGRDCLKMGFKKAIMALPKVNCNGCWDVAACEFNLSLFNIHLRDIAKQNI